MTTQAPLAPTTAARAARRHWIANVAALSSRQPWLVANLGDMPTQLEWLFARDGSLTARDVASNTWFAGCSVPARAAGVMLKHLSLNGVLGCFLLPFHAAAVKAALDKLERRQAIVVLEPDPQALALLLCCADFTDAIKANRVWFVTGADWPAMTAEVFARVPGLPTPSQFIRTAATPEEATASIIPIAEKAFQQVNDRRAQSLAAVSVGTTNRNLLLVAPSHFRLWDDAGHAITSTFLADTNANTIHLDPDDPAQSSALGLALAAASASALLVPNRGRGDLPDVVPHETPLITWITEPRVPPFNPSCSKDALLLADNAWLSAAQKVGWPRNRLAVANWPASIDGSEPSFAQPGAARGVGQNSLLENEPALNRASLALIADTRTLETPVTELELSSHHVLWELIRSDLAHDPLSLGPDVDAFLNRRMQKLGISDEGLDRAKFIQQLILPAYAQGLARLLVAANLPLTLHGVGWSDLPEFALLSRGPIRTRGEFHTAVAGATVLVYPWPARRAHAIDGCGRPVLYVNSRDPRQWAREGARLLRDRPVAPAEHPLTPDVVRSVLA